MIPQTRLTFTAAFVAAFILAAAGCTLKNTDYPPNLLNPAGPGESKTDASGEVRIHTIQGASLRSPLEGQLVTGVPGIVIAFRGDGFYMQDPDPDGLIETSEGIFVYTGTVPKVRSGDAVRVDGRVEEFQPGGTESNNQPITHIVDARVTLMLSGNKAPEAVVLGENGVLPPWQTIENDKGVNFDPAEDGLDFYESLESMLITINQATVVGATNGFGETVILPDGLFNLRSSRGGLLASPEDLNPERLILDDNLQSIPSATTGDRLDGPITGIMDFSFGSFKLQPISPVKWSRSGLKPETARAANVDELTVATYNLDNLSAADDESRFVTFAGQIVSALLSPDILILEEVQDNNGVLDDGTVDANLTYRRLTDAIQRAGGPDYQFRDVRPGDNQDGGEVGGNIRVGFLFRTDRGLEFVDRPGKSAKAVTLLEENGLVRLSQSPGRIGSNDDAFLGSRKPLVGEFIYREKPLFLVGLHLNSKGPDSALYGLEQPPFEYSAPQRQEQAAIIHAFIGQLIVMEPNARVIVAGDLNDFQFSQTLKTLKGNELHNTIESLAPEEQYTYVFEGNSQVLDHILVSNSLLRTLTGVDIVHLNAEFPAARRESDHDPVVVYLTIH